jgi:hypothetical protein
MRTSIAAPDIRISTAMTLEPKAPDAAESTPGPAKASASSSASPPRHSLPQFGVVFFMMILVRVAFSDTFFYQVSTESPQS